MALTIVEHPLVQHKLSILRDEGTSTGLFRQLATEIAQLMMYDVTRDLELTKERINTPLMAMDAPKLKGKKLAFVSILRAGNALLEGALSIVPSARVGYVGLYRDEETLRPVQYYCNLPAHLDQRPVVALDPMLATGNSSVAAIDLIKAAGATDIRFVCLVASPEGVARIEEAHPDVALFAGALDTKLNEVGYIVPGLGDAGDRTFGTK